LRTFFDALDFEFPFCPAPSIGDTAGSKSADCLSPAVALAEAGRVSAGSGRVDDAQDQAGRGVFFWFVFFDDKENEQILYPSIPRIGSISPGPPPEVAGLG